MWSNEAYDENDWSWQYSTDGKVWSQAFIKHDTKDVFTGRTDNDGKEIFGGDRINYNFKTKDSDEVFSSIAHWGEYMWLTDEHSLNRASNVMKIE